MTAVLDASALLRFLDDEPGAERVQSLLSRARAGEAELLMSAVNWGEVIYAIARKRGADAARDLAAKLSTLPLAIIACSITEAMEAGLFKERFHLPFADAFAGSLALRRAATLVTADFDFKSLPSGTLKIDFLPRK
jgi:predicted nucleic acid-binding protein